MRYHWLSALLVLTIARLVGLATPLTSHWHNMHVKHAWKAAPPNWESLGAPSPSTTIDIQLALKPANESVLIDTLYDVSTPGNPKYVFPTLLHARCTYYECRRSVVDMARTYQGRKSLSLSRRTKTPSS